MLTSKFAHIHIPRTGGSTLRTFLGHISGAVVIDATMHMPYDDMEEIQASFGYPMPPAFAFIRHPCSWYVSHWCWMAHTDDYGVKGVSFGDFMKALATEAVNTRTFTGYWHHLSVDYCQYIGRFENFEDEAVRILRAIIPGMITEATIRAKIRTAGRVRQVPRPDGRPAGDWRQYYTAGWLAQVVEWDGALMRRYGYRI